MTCRQEAAHKTVCEDPRIRGRRGRPAARWTDFLFVLGMLYGYHRGRLRKTDRHPAWRAGYVVGHAAMLREHEDFRKAATRQAQSIGALP